MSASNAAKRMPVDSGTCIFPVSHLYMRLVLTPNPPGVCPKRRYGATDCQKGIWLSGRVRTIPKKKRCGVAPLSVYHGALPGVSVLSALAPHRASSSETVLLIRRRIPHRRLCAPSLERLGQGIPELEYMRILELRSRCCHICRCMIRGQCMHARTSMV